MSSDERRAVSDEWSGLPHRSSLIAQHSYISLAVAARLLDMAPASVRRAIVEGRLWGQRVGYPWITSVEAVEEYRRTPRHAGGRPRRHPPTAPDSPFVIRHSSLEKRPRG